MKVKMQIAGRIGCAPLHALDAITQDIWMHYGAGRLSDEEANQLAELARARRAALKAQGPMTRPIPVARCPVPVLRNSHFRGRSEARIWKPTTRQDLQKILLAAKHYERVERQKGKRTGPLGSVAIEVLEYFVNLVDFKTGRLEPSIQTIMRKIRRSRDAVVRALKALRQHGFLDWLRRYEPTGKEGRGPQVQQTSNAYCLSLPQKALRLLGFYGRPAPLPDDWITEQKEREAQRKAWRKTLPLAEQVLFDFGDNPLGQAFAALARLVEQRESVEQTESKSDFFI